MIIAADRLERAVAAIFLAAGSCPREAGLIASHLVLANLSGHDSHGVGMVPGYIAAVGRGDMKLNHRLSLARDDGAILVCDGGNGAGQVMAFEAMELGIARARERGAAIVALRDSYHIGRIGHWAEQCAAAGMVSLHFVNVPAHAAVAAFGGTAPRLGTNPFCAGFPRPGGEPIIVDFATSRWAVGKVRVAWKKGEPVPPGTLLDAEGRPTRDPAVIFEPPVGALLPFGEHKGFGLALACEILAGAVIGGLTQDGTPMAAITNSMLSVVLSPAAVGGGRYAAQLDTLAAWVASEDGVCLPGEPERERRARLRRDGVAIDPASWAEIVAAAASVGIADLEAAAG
ncbi:MAG: malate/lactate/ureidoglycolate dehydrogenase [Thalassobaculales bacterium]